ncbi:hypothetical protein ACFX11_020074 [Malus domestica]
MRGLVRKDSRNVIRTLTHFYRRRRGRSGIGRGDVSGNSLNQIVEQIMRILTNQNPLFQMPSFPFSSARSVNSHNLLHHPLLKICEIAFPSEMVASSAPTMVASTSPSVDLQI